MKSNILMTVNGMPDPRFQIINAYCDTIRMSQDNDDDDDDFDLAVIISQK